MVPSVENIITFLFIYLQCDSRTCEPRVKQQTERRFIPKRQLDSRASLLVAVTEHCRPTQRALSDLVISPKILSLIFPQASIQCVRARKAQWHKRPSFNHKALVKATRCLSLNPYGLQGRCLLVNTDPLPHTGKKKQLPSKLFFHMLLLHIWPGFQM